MELKDYRQRLQTRLECIRQSLSDVSNPMPTIDYIAGLRRHAKLLLDKAERVEQALTQACLNAESLRLEELEIRCRFNVLDTLPDECSVATFEALYRAKMRELFRE